MDRISEETIETIIFKANIGTCKLCLKPILRLKCVLRGMETEPQKISKDNVYVKPPIKERQPTGVSENRG